MRGPLLAAALFGLLLAPSDELSAGETPYSGLYYRGVADESGVLGILRSLAIRRKADAMLVVFDPVTFSPPPGWNEFNFSHDFPGDIPDWLSALAKWKPPEGTSVQVATTLMPRPVPVGDPALQAGCRARWWDAKGFRRFEPATGWMSRLLGKVPGSRKMLVLVTGEVLPEVWADRSLNTREREGWRRKLLDRGAYWNEEAIGSLLSRSGATLDVVAPEARFGDFLPFTDIPEAPWAARPVTLLGRQDPGLAKGVSPGPDFGGEPGLPAARFASTTPAFCTHYGSFTFFNTDCPSRYGYWPFVRAAAKTGGSYIFYPFPAVDFLDPCPYDPVLVATLAPEEGGRSDFLKAKAGDPALQALAKAVKLVIAKTPWSDGHVWSGGGRRSSGWLAFASTSPLVMEKRYRERNKPFDWIERRPATVAEWKRYGREIREVPPHYDRAIEILDAAAKEIALGKVARPHRRSLANLRLARFWLEMSAFHLEALSIYLTELDKHVPKEMIDGRGEILITYVPTIRMSDCLAGYEGRSVSEEKEKELAAAWAGFGAPWMKRSQSNILFLPIRSHWYRALRHPSRVMKNLDDRLKPRAVRMIDAGAEVMRHEGRSPWGWIVYYSEACTFVYWRVPETRIPRERPGDADDPPDGTSTPRPRPRARGPNTGR